MIHDAEYKNYHSYHIPGQPAHQTLKKNAVFISTHCTVKHELAKSLAAIMIKNFGDVYFNPNIIKAINEIDKEIKNLKMTKNECNFITEAVPNKDKTRRIDLVNITTGDMFEFETNKKVNKGSDVTTIYL
jgi:hypothetical protein